jgi:glyoxylase-like metal-dependent hydrolase (beta-lactamase superfamily II)
MLRGTIDGVGPDEAAEQETQDRIRAYAAAQPTVYLVAHDPGVPARLAQRQTTQHPLVEVAA